jgi:predicted site-specific integrase-resolvase
MRLACSASKTQSMTLTVFPLATVRRLGGDTVCLDADNRFRTWRMARGAGAMANTGKFVAYYRVSTQKQGRSRLGLEAQREAVRTYLNGGNWSIAAESTEVESGRNVNRRRRLRCRSASGPRADHREWHICRMRCEMTPETMFEIVSAGLTRMSTTA